MARSGILHYNNRLLGDLVTIAPSSEQPSFTREALQRASPRDRLRWQTGWDVVTGVNDRIDFNRGGVRIATIAQGHYSTPNDYALGVKAGMDAGDGTDTYAVSQNVTTGRWTLTNSAGHTFTVLGATGANIARGALTDLGFAAADTSAAVAATGALGAFMSRKWVNIDLGQASDSGVYTFRAGENDALDFGTDADGSPLLAEIPAGRYTAVTLAPTLKTILHAAGPNETWAVLWNSATQHWEFTTAPTGHQFLTGSGANLSRDAWRDLGFNTGSNSTSATFHESAFAVNGSPPRPIDVAFLLGHNLPTSATARLDADDADMTAVGLGTTVDFSTTLGSVPGVELRRADVDGLEHRYYRLVIDATGSGGPGDPVTFVEVGVLFLSGAVELPGIEPALSDTRYSLTSVTITPGGQHTAVQRNSRRGYTLDVHLIDDDGRDTLESVLDTIGVGGMFFFELDPDDDAYAARYMFFLDEADFEKVEERNGDLRLWTLQLVLFEAVR